MSIEEEMKQYAYENHVPIMQDQGIQLVLDTLQKNDCSSFLEIGTAIGRTSILVAQLREDMRVVTIERDAKMIAQAKLNIKEAGLEKQITLIEGDALEVELPSGKFDCIFIDAAKAQYERFFKKYCPLLKDNGIILSDNMNFHGLVDHPERTQNRNTKALVKKIARYRDFLKNLEEFETVFYEDGDGVALTRRKQK